MSRALACNSSGSPTAVVVLAIGAVAGLAACGQNGASVVEVRGARDTSENIAVVDDVSDSGDDTDADEDVAQVDITELLDEPPEECAETNLVPPALQGDIELLVANPTDVITPTLGYDTRRGELLQVCVGGEIGQSAGTDVTYEVRQIETRADLSEALSVGVDVSVGFMGYGFDNRFRLARSRELNTYNLNIWLRVRVVTGTSTLIAGVQLLPQFAELLQTDPFEFLERCGDRFVNSVTYGGELIVILSVETSSEADRFELENRLSARFGIFGSLSADVESSLSEELEGRSVTIEVTRTGGGGALPVMTTAEELLDYARQFPAEVADNPPVPFSFVTRPYDRIHDGTVCLPGFDEKSIRLMDDAWDALNDAVGVRNALAEAIGNPQAYACGDNEERRAQLERVEAFIEALEEAASACAREVSVPPSGPGTGAACSELERVMLEFEAPPMPLRWQEVLVFDASARERYNSFFLSESLVCTVVGIEGLWSQWPANNDCPEPDTCWRECPDGTLNGSEFSQTFEDRSNWGDNRGVCTYTFGCFNVEDAYLLEACEGSGEGSGT